MKLTESDKRYLVNIGHEEKDFAQIEEALSARTTTYELNKVIGHKLRDVSREEAISLLGRNLYLSGIARSAFHGTAIRENEQGDRVLFDSTKLFRPKRESTSDTARTDEHLKESTIAAKDNMPSDFPERISAIAEHRGLTKDDEILFILRFVVKCEDTVSFRSNQSRLLFLNQIRAMWTAYCIHNACEPDTNIYDNGFYAIFEAIQVVFGTDALNPKTGKDAFDLFMGEYLC